MSQPIRYGLADADLGRIHPQADGHLVMWSDYAAIAADNERLKADTSEGYLLQSFLKWKGMQDEYQEWLDWRSERPSKEGGAK